MIAKVSDRLGLNDGLLAQV